MPIKPDEASKGSFPSRLVSAGDRTELIEDRLDFTEPERAQLTSFLGVESLDRFSFEYRLEPISKNRFHLTGTISAELTQLCVVSLEPVFEQVEEAVSLECRPQDQLTEVTEDDKGLASDELPEDPPVPIIDNKVDLGALAVEILASAINPYPRKKGSEFDWADPKVEGNDNASGPFGELAKLKSGK